MWLFSDVPCAVIEINKEVQNAIRDCVLKSGQKFEVGGILLGRKMPQKILVEELTIPEDFQNCKRGSFQLDGKVAAESCEKLIAKAPWLDVVGLWHSHLYGIAEFSSQDRQTNQLFSRIYGRCVSVLAVQLIETVQINLYELDDEGNTYLAKILLNGGYKS